MFRYPDKSAGNRVGKVISMQVINGTPKSISAASTLLYEECTRCRAAASGSSSCSPTSSNAGDFDAAGEVPCMDLDEAAALIAAAGGEALHDDAQVAKV